MVTIMQGDAIRFLGSAPEPVQSFCIGHRGFLWDEEETASASGNQTRLSIASILGLPLDPAGYTAPPHPRSGIPYFLRQSPSESRTLQNGC